MINHRRLQYFVTVADELHFGRAAQRLHIAQPPLSQQIRQLETDLGLTLFERTTRRVRLTDSGQLLLAPAREALAAMGEFERRSAELRSGDVGVLRLGLVDSASYEAMPKFLQRYRSRWPGVEHHLSTMSSDAQIRALAAGEIDVGIARTTGSTEGLVALPLVAERMVLAVDSEHRLAEEAITSIAGLRDETFIGFDRQVSPSLHLELSEMMANVGVRYDPVIEATEYATILSLVASGLGVAVVPASVQSLRPPTLRYIRIRDQVASTALYLLTRADSPSVQVRRAVELAEELFGAPQP